MGNSQYCRQHYITYHYHSYKYSLPSVAGFIQQSGYYYLFPLPEISGGQGSERVNKFRCQKIIFRVKNHRQVCTVVKKQNQMEVITVS